MTKYLKNSWNLTSKPYMFFVSWRIKWYVGHKLRGLP